ncbi:MAG: molecular chaperone DnaK [Nanoarchaeota archaeon]|nr:molecular chaperone DnaK [Nanoarchaeota archaeon]MCG2718383.1 molecular chaperone DnaK [Nanoarchaeota archaeon]
MSKKEKIIGIDLGTSNSAASVIQGGKATIVPSAEGASLYGKAFPSIVAFTKDDTKLVGEPARRQSVSNSEGTITAAKRKMGTKHVYKIHGKEFTPQQISAFILQKIKEDSEKFIGEKITKAVITVPAYFDDDQRQATKDAGTIAGLEVVRIINEPTAAALSYGLDKQEKDQKILVFDLGGGTLDVTIMELGEGVFEVKSTSGDTQLGGTDMDEEMVKFVVEHFKKETGIDLNEDNAALQRVREACEKAKIELSTVVETDLNLPFISATDKGPKHLNMKITRAQLEKLVDPLVQKCGKSLETAIKLAKDINKPSDIDKVILVGGPTRMPVVKNFVENFIGKKAEGGVDPMECVALGAAIQGGVLSEEIKDVLLLDVTPLTLGIETLGGIKTPLISRNTSIPTSKTQIFSTAADNQPAVTINVLQGEREMSADNKSLGRFDLVGIPSAPRGIPQIEVTFDIDANGIINVSAKDKGTGKEQSIAITASQKLNEEEVEKMRKEAEKYADEDKKKKESIEIKNQADAVIYQTEKMLTDYKDKIDKKTSEKVMKSLIELKEAVGKDDVDDIKAKMDSLQKTAQEIGAQMYQQQAQQKSQEQSEEKPKKEKKSKDDENVVDAEFKVEDEEKENKKK